MDAIPADLRARIEQIIDYVPSSGPVFNDLIQYFITRESGPPDAKKRKLDASQDALLEPSLASRQITLDSDVVVFKDLSVSIPDRKKGTVIITNGSIAVTFTTRIDTVPEQGTILPEYVYDRAFVTGAFLLQLADKAKPQWNFLITGKLPGSEFVEPLLQISVTDAASDKYLFGAASQSLAALSLKDAVKSAFKFVPLISGGGSGSGSGLCVACHRGSKEGYLYFLDGWIFFGFKKPLLLFDVLNQIESVSYSSITRLTLNLIIKLVSPIAEGQEFEFSMIDQTEYDAINSYVVSNSLSNQSMSEARRAKQASTKPEFSNELQSAAQNAPEILGTAAAAAAGDDVAAAEGSVNMAQDDFPSSDEEDVNYEGGESGGESGEESGEEGEGEELGEEDSEDEDEDEEADQSEAEEVPEGEE